MESDAWEWDESLYAGAAPYYVRGRMPYPPEMRDALRREIGLDGTGRLLDVGCGPGSVTLVLGGQFGEAVGVDPDRGMLDEADRVAREQRCSNVRWVCRRAEELPAGLGTFRVAVLAQSFHWMERPRVASILHGMLEPAGALVHVGATTDGGVPGDEPLPRPRPPRDAITELVRGFLGPHRRAGLGVLPSGTPSGEDEILVAAGFRGPRRVEVGGGEVVERSEDEIVASVFSLSSAAPHLFGDRVTSFESELRQLLRRASPDGRFCEQRREITLSIWDR